MSKCKKCGKETKSGYNTPNGFYCVECEHKYSNWAKKNFSTPLNALNEREAGKISFNESTLEAMKKELAK